MISLKSVSEIKQLREGGEILAQVLKTVSEAVRPGVSAAELDKLAYQLIVKKGGRPSFLNFRPEFSDKAFPASLCVSINDVIVHGVPTAQMILQKGDVISLDIGMEYKKLYTDMAVTVSLNPIKPVYKKLIEVTKNSLGEAIKAAQPGNTLGDIGFAIQNHAESNGFVVIHDLGGHGVGHAVHEDPFVFNFGQPGEGIRLQPGMVLAIEPMITLKSRDIKEHQDGSFSTSDGQVAAHFEHTIAITPNGNMVITALK